MGKGKKKCVDPVQMINIEVTYCIKTQDKHEVKQDLKNIKNVKGCRDGMPKSMQTR